MSQARRSSSLGGCPWGPSVTEHRQATELAEGKTSGVQQLGGSSGVRKASPFSGSAFPDLLRHRATNSRMI